MSIKFHNLLSDKIWDGFELKLKVRERLLKITEFFLLQILDIPNNLVLDIHMVGSLCGYNYTKYSDIDIHVIVDFTKINEDVQIVTKMTKLFSDLFNSKYSITVKGYEVLMNVQDSNTKLHSKGIFSIQDNKWISKPLKLNDVIIDDLLVQVRVDNLIDSIDNNLDNLLKLNKIKLKLKNMRRSGLLKEGLFSILNIVFKKLRNKGYLKKLKERIILLRNQLLTLLKGNILLCINDDKFRLINNYVVYSENPSIKISLRLNNLNLFIDSIYFIVLGKFNTLITREAKISNFNNLKKSLYYNSSLVSLKTLTLMILIARTNKIN